jgi:hypothetical protein
MGKHVFFLFFYIKKLKFNSDHFLFEDFFKNNAKKTFFLIKPSGMISCSAQAYGGTAKNFLSTSL